jgi:hypothetical protein
MLLQAGEGSAEERAHLRACPRCAARHRALEDDLGVIADALRAGPPRGAAHPRLRWRAVGALAATVALAVGAAWLWRGAPVAPRGGGGDVSALVEDLAGTLFATSEVTAAGEQSDEAAAFDEDDELALLFEGP